MHLRMTALRQKKNGEWIARKGIPQDVRDEYARMYGRGWEERLTLPAGTLRAAAIIKHTEWLAETEARIDALRASKRGDGIGLTRVQALGLAGRWYDWFVGQHEHNSGEPKRWRERYETLIWDVLRPRAQEEYEADPKSDPQWEWTRAPEVREAVRPLIAEEARTAAFLASAGLSLNDEATALFVDAVADNLPHAFSLLERRARGDYSPDETPQTFPRFESERRHSSDGDGPNLWQLFEMYVTAHPNLADGTVGRWRGVFLDLQSAYPNTPAQQFSEENAREWANKLVTPKRSASTVKGAWLAGAKSVFRWGHQEKHLPTNPFQDITAPRVRKETGRESKAFEDKEVSLVLKAASALTTPRTLFEHAKRWVVWLCAYTGARAGEMTQLRGIDVREAEPGLYAITITPKAGTVKTKDTRTIPLHEHLIEQGFLQFVKQRGSGPLFYEPRNDTGEPKDRMKPKRARSVSVRARLGEWTRELGVNDPEVSPTHGWRHTFKQRASRAGISDRMSDFITGHSQATEGAKYGAPTLRDRADELKKFPRYVI